MIRRTQEGSVRVLTLEHGKLNTLDVELLEASAAELAACGDALLVLWY